MFMPVGVLKVPFLIDGDEEASWTELYYVLYHRRILFLGEEIKPEISNQLVGLMVYLSLADNEKDLYMFINSPGGDVISGMAIYDGMQFVDTQVHTIYMGIAPSMASLILIGGEIFKRLAFPHARIMIHEPVSSFFDGQMRECRLEESVLKDIREDILYIYTQRACKSYTEITNDIERDSFLSADEAQSYGLIDEIAHSYSSQYLFGTKKEYEDEDDSDPRS